MSRRILKLSVILSLSCLSALMLNAQEYQKMINQFEQYTVEEIQESAEAYFKVHGTGKGSGYKHWKRWEFNAERMVDDQGYLKSDQYYFHELARYNQVQNLKNQNRSFECESEWKPLGPVELNVTSGYNPGIGRITSFSVDGRDSSHMIIGSQTGGVWQSLDGGNSWLPLTDEYVNMVVYSLTIDPSDSDIYYWGGNQGAIFKSTDRGLSWMQHALGEPGRVNKIIVDPLDSLQLWASSDSRGVFHSIDGGVNWRKVVDDEIHDIEFHPTDTSVVYASGIQLWRSADRGRSFDVLPFGSNNFQAKMMAVSPASPDHVYLLQCSSGTFEGLYISRDRGETFERKDHGSKNFLGYSFTADDQAGQAPRDMDIVVSALDSNEIFLAGINLWRSFNGGDSFEILTHWIYPVDDSATYSYCHADIDILEWRDGKVFIGSDGGFYLLEDSRDTLIRKKTVIERGKGINVHQFYRIGVGQTDPPMVSGGAQDNGSSVWIGNQWNSWFGADGMESFILSDTDNTIFGTYQFGGLLFSRDGGQSVEYVNGLGDLQGSGNWVTPFEKDPTDSTTIYVGFDRIYKSSDYGFTFDTISQFLYPSLFKIAPSGSDTMYASRGSSLYRTMDGGMTDWELIYDGAGFGSPNINYIAIHPRDAQMVALAVSGGEKVLLSRNGGEDWVSLREDLPNFRAISLTWQNNDYESLYLGMNYGIYYRDSLTQAWEPFSTGIPNVIVNELEINEKTQEIYAATYGRGLWVSPVCNPITNNNEVEDPLSFEIAPNPVSRNEDIRITIGSGVHDGMNLKIYDQRGYLRYRGELPRGENNIYVSTKNWASGIYYLRGSSVGQTFTRLINVQ